MNSLIITMTNKLDQVLIKIFPKKLINLLKLTKIQLALCWLFILQWHTAFTTACFKGFKSKISNLNTYCNEKLNCDKNWIFKYCGIIFLKLKNSYVKYIFCINKKLWPKKYVRLLVFLLL